ncbi:Uma2 family endonuclease [Okeania sp.]|uniref:Uma2 family endonuclease n=1 Tax=Okeania sp. TaxID=3100323 RepID=UPI002B4B8966|nr:Uma2 family endonuclease [Okeania sp.]MEB3341265.1 Uma2 family endonuclease [Okeania sp.]
MTGKSIPHNDISVNLAVALKNHLRGKKRKVLMADAKLGVSENGLFYYPDVMVTCDQRDRRATKVIYHPCLVVEVLSPGTEAFNRGKKFKNYRNISTLKEYVLIDAQEMTIECFRLNKNGFWELCNYGEGDEVNLTSVDLSFPIEMLYEDVFLEEAGE